MACSRPDTHTYPYHAKESYDTSHLPLIPQCSSLGKPYATALTPIPTPPGHYPIDIVQFWRGQRSPTNPFPLHWAIFIPTSPTHGNYYELVGNIDTFTPQALFNVPRQKPELWRGSHRVGYVSPGAVDWFQRRMAGVEVKRGCRGWNCQNWVYEVVVGLRYEELYTDHMLTLGALQTQMSCLLEAWELGEI